MQPPLIARVALVLALNLLEYLTEVVSLGRLERWKLLVCFQLLQPQLLTDRHYGKSVIHKGRTRSGQ